MARREDGRHVEAHRGGASGGVHRHRGGDGRRQRSTTGRRVRDEAAGWHIGTMGGASGLGGATCRHSAEERRRAELVNGANEDSARLSVRRIYGEGVSVPVIYHSRH